MTPDETHPAKRVKATQSRSKKPVQHNKAALNDKDAEELRHLLGADQGDGCGGIDMYVDYALGRWLIVFLPWGRHTPFRYKQADALR